MKARTYIIRRDFREAGGFELVASLPTKLRAEQWVLDHGEDGVHYFIAECTLCLTTKDVPAHRSLDRDYDRDYMERYPR